MATVHIAIGYSKGRGVGGAQLPVKQSVLSRSESLTSSGTSAPGNLVATQAEVDSGALWFITTTGDLLVTAGTAPTAASTNAHRVQANTTVDLAITTVGEKLAIKDA